MRLKMHKYTGVIMVIAITIITVVGMLVTANQP